MRAMKNPVSGLRLYTTAIMVREHLPGRALAGWTFPMLSIRHQISIQATLWHDARCEFLAELHRCTSNCDSTGGLVGDVESDADILFACSETYRYPFITP